MEVKVSVILEFFENDVKVAECPAKEVFELPRTQYADFWHVQDVRERSIKLRIEEGENES